MNTKLLAKLKEVFNVLSRSNKVSFENRDLFTFSDSKILTPVEDVLPLLLNQKSKLKDQFVEIDLLTKLIDTLNKNKSIVRLSHIGFCYKVDSLVAEKERLIDLVKKSKFHLYQEPSNDSGLWLFLGNITNWEEPVIELIPVEKTNDQWVDYWLPHIQIDIDTTLTGKEIESLVKLICGNAISPFSIVIGSYTYIVKNRLGTIDGVNITLDLATAARKVRVLRENVWKKIV